MKKIFIILILMSAGKPGFSQNFILNPDFEQFTFCPTANGELQLANNWIDVVYSCDYMNCIFPGWTTQAVPGAQSGNGYAGFATYGSANGAAEAFGQFLATPLIAGNSYRINFFAKKSDSGFYSNICTGVCLYGFSGNPIPGGAQTGICAGTLPGAFLLGCSDTVIDVLWQSYTIDFIAPATLDYIVLTPGCAINCAEYIYIDNIHLTEMINYSNVCFGDTTLFSMTDTASMVSASWSFSDLASGINNTSTLFNPSHIFTSAGTFLVRVIRTYVNTFVDTVIIPVTIYPQVSVSLAEDTIICQGESVMLDASGPSITNYLWQDGSVASTYVAGSTGAYIVTVSNPGCSASDTFNLDVIPCTTVSSGFQSSVSQICPGTCVDFTNLSQNATLFTWSFSGANPAFSTDVNPLAICYNLPGSYDVQLIASDGLNSDTLILPDYITVFPFPPPQGILQSGDTLFALQGSVSYQWYYSGNIIPGATDYYYIATQSGNYNVVCTDLNGCEVEAVLNNVIAEADGQLALLTKSEGLATFPNPVRETLTVTGYQLSGTAGEISIYNVIGEKIAAYPIDSQKNEYTLDVRSIPAGVYWLSINEKEKTMQVKFLKQ